MRRQSRSLWERRQPQRRPAQAEAYSALTPGVKRKEREREITVRVVGPEQESDGTFSVAKSSSSGREVAMIAANALPSRKLISKSSTSTPCGSALARHHSS